MGDFLRHSENFHQGKVQASLLFQGRTLHGFVTKAVINSDPPDDEYFIDSIKPRDIIVSRPEPTRWKYTFTFEYEE
jgi:hypothetical protein